MRRFLIPALVIAVAIALPLFAAPFRSSCGPGGCSIAPDFAPAPEPVQADAYRWVRYANEPDHAYLMKGKTQVGGWWKSRQAYRELLDFAKGEWGPEQDEAPFPPPADMLRAAPEARGGQSWETNGIPVEQLCKHPRVSINGQGVAFDTGMGAVEKGILGDDSKKLFLTVWWRDKDKRDIVVGDMKRDHEFWKWVEERCFIRADASSHADYHFTKDRAGDKIYGDIGNVSISLLAPDGEELWRDDGYTQGPASLEDLRKKDPAYRPDNSPGPKPPAPPKKPDDKKAAEEDDFPVSLLLLIMGGGLFLFVAKFLLFD